jgi:signal recognition particle GTPase
MRIFVSYASEDKELLDKLEETLRKHDVVGNEAILFFDPKKELETGDNVREKLRAQIEAASKVILIHTDKSESSQWVNYEVGMADALGKPIIVVGRKGAGKSALISKLADVTKIEIDE